MKFDDEEPVEFVEGITKTRRRHPGYIRGIDFANKFPGPYIQNFGEWQYWYRNGKGEVDAVSLPDYFMDGKDFWEIYSGDTLFSDVERFDTLEEAEDRIKEILLS